MAKLPAFPSTLLFLVPGPRVPKWRRALGPRRRTSGGSFALHYRLPPVFLCRVGRAAARTGARTSLVESSPDGVAAARQNLGGVEVVAARVETALRKRRITGPVHLVVLDPPRSGAGAEVVKAIAAAGPRAVAYVACDPAALGRDVGTFRRLGWSMSSIRAFDCFPMTRHVECVALLTP